MTISNYMLPHNLMAWVIQTSIVALTAALLPIVFRVRHPRTQLVYCHLALALCLFLPLAEPWGLSAARWFPAVLAGTWMPTILGIGIVLQLVWLSGGLWRIRRYRISATPLYPVPEAMQAASAITHADALFCISQEASSPVMLGWLAPVILLPTAFLTLDEEAQCGIACHELLHVRRGDWLVTLIEECAGALLWFNPGVWLLLSEARLAREQLVDAESVRLTASREPYIDALLAIARGRVWSDLLPAPSFLRRSHLTQRMQSLLSDTPTSLLRVAGSYLSIGLILAGSVWMACASFPMLAQAPIAMAAASAAPHPIATQSIPQQPAASPQIRPTALTTAASLPPVVDPYEPVTGGVESVTSPQERAAALSLLAKARENGLKHAPGTPPFRFTMSLVASGNALNTGQGELTETWLTGQRWKWTTSLGGVSHTRLFFRGQLLEEPHVTVIPMRAHMMRNEVFWAVRGFSPNVHLRIAKPALRGNAATCILTSEGLVDPPPTQGRLWSEEEFCVDDVSGALLIHSIAPGTYAQFDYDSNLRFHNRAMPNQLRIYVAGNLVADASFNIVDAEVADEASLVPSASMTSTPRPVGLGGEYRAAIVFSGRGSGAAEDGQPVVVHAELDGEGNVVEAEVSASANPALVPAALEQIRKTTFGFTGTQREAYFDVRFVPATHQ